MSFSDLRVVQNQELQVHTFCMIVFKMMNFLSNLRKTLMQTLKAVQMDVMVSYVLIIAESVI